MTLSGLFAGLAGLWTISLLYLAVVVILYALAAKEDERLSELELPTWSEAQEVAADQSYYDALREWQQSVELPMARPLSRSGVSRLRRDLSKPVRLTQAEAEHVREILFPKSRRTPKEVA